MKPPGDASVVGKCLTLEVLSEAFAICRLAPDAVFPAWAQNGPFISYTKTDEELSLVCLSASVPAGVRKEGPWRAFKVQGPLAFGLTGILAALAVPLAEAHLSIFAVSTYDTDYLLVKTETLTAATKALESAGHLVR